MKRRIIGVLGGLTSAALVASALQAPAAAAPPENPHEQGAVKSKKDDRPDPLSDRRRAGKKRAIELVLSGKRQVQQRGGSESVRVGDQEWVEYEQESEGRLLSFLVEFGGTESASTDPYPTAGPLHNQIPAPDRSTDNTTYWESDFSRDHYRDMFFAPEGESFANVYEELSSGRYTVTGDVSDWVKVDQPEGAYGLTESHRDMTFFIDDTAEAWYAAQVAAGRTPKQIKDYLATFDRWDRYDFDGDGNFDEADGYIDHFQAIHAGEGEEAGAPEWAIWSHRWAVNQNGFHADGIGPRNAPFGGIQIGTTGFWIRDYTTEPENGGLGVFAHEYAHDLGLPDLYDTQGGENGTGFWTLMSSGSWLGDGGAAIGTTPNHMGAWEKLMLGWLDYGVARPAEAESTHDLGPSMHATKDQQQAVVAVLPDKSVTVDLGAAAEGSDYFYSGRGDERVATMTSPAFPVATGERLSAQVKYDIEAEWDYAYLDISTDGGTTWTPLQTDHSTSEDPNDVQEGFGITGTTNGSWAPLTADLSAYAGRTAQVRFRMVNDAYVNETGLLVDAVRVGGLSAGAEDGAGGWTLDRFSVVEGGKIQQQHPHYYIAENRVYDGYDRTLQTGPYNFGWQNSRPNWVEHFPYQDGLLVWYWNTQYTDNNTSVHPGGGEVLPVDARAKALYWSDRQVARNRIQSFDATFGLTPTVAISLHREGSTRPATLDVRSQRAVPLFDDSRTDAYYDARNPGHSTLVGGTGTQIQVLSDSGNGSMRVVVR